MPLSFWARHMDQKQLLNPNESSLHRLFTKNGVIHIDDMSSIIIQYFNQYIINKL